MSLQSLSHGNADVERGFSENAALITDDRSSLSDISINGLRATKDAVKFYGQGKVHEVPICKGLLDNVKEAHSRYQVDQEKKTQRILKEKEAIAAASKLTKNKELILVEKLQNLLDQRKILQEDLENASKMFNEGNSRLDAAVATKNFAGVAMAQLLIGGGGDRSGRGGDRSGRGGDRSGRGGDRSGRGGDRSERGGDRSGCSDKDESADRSERDDQVAGGGIYRARLLLPEHGVHGGNMVWKVEKCKPIKSSRALCYEIISKIIEIEIYAVENFFLGYFQIGLSIYCIIISVYILRFQLNDLIVDHNTTITNSLARDNPVEIRSLLLSARSLTYETSQDLSHVRIDENQPTQDFKQIHSVDLTKNVILLSDNSKYGLTSPSSSTKNEIPPLFSLSSLLMHDSSPDLSRIHLNETQTRQHLEEIHGVGLPKIVIVSSNKSKHGSSGLSSITSDIPPLLLSSRPLPSDISQDLSHVRINENQPTQDFKQIHSVDLTENVITPSDKSKYDLTSSSPSRPPVHGTSQNSSIDPKASDAKTIQ
ncbi:unnamed protein product [Rotaria magnacalcarata]|uniref:Uncharacterized protein n=3 Tax=Rotaria magnacalcarata TaxID=392030 RepID=A0A816F1W4_9BILA|nr:unnamed protein product [Rotaria magnacalcarata]